MTLRCSLRLPPTKNAAALDELLKKTLTEPSADTFGAILEYTLVDAGQGMAFPDLPVPLLLNLKAATKEVFGAD